ncbi:MAG: hypothetical protein ACWGNV_16350 [Bacteroidales bacterium]
MNKRIAPTVILVLVIFFILVQAGVMIWALNKEGLGMFWTLLIILAPLAIIVALITVYIERMKEIDDEEKDDLSKY